MKIYFFLKCKTNYHPFIHYHNFKVKKKEEDGKCFSVKHFEIVIPNLIFFFYNLFFISFF